MKLLRLQINTKFRSLHQGFEIRFNEPTNKTFLEFNPYCLVGKNGSGKSNILEAIAAIFYHLECTYLETRPTGFDKDEENPEGFDAKKSIPEAFELEYVIPATFDTIKGTIEDYKQVQINQIKTFVKVIKKENEYAQIFIHNGEGFNADEPRKVEGSIKGKSILPGLIVGYSSGENEILSLPFLKIRFIQFDEYKRNSDRDSFVKPETRLIYADNQHTQAIILTLLLMENDKNIFKPFKNNIEIEDIKTFRIIIRQNQELEVDEELKKTITNQNLEENLRRTTENQVKLSEEDFKKELTIGIEKTLSSNVDSVINKSIVQKFKDCSTCFYKDELDNLILDYWVNQDTKDSFQLHFGTSFELFRTFQTLLNLNIFSVPQLIKEELYQSGSLYVNETIPTVASDERIFRFKDFAVKKRGIERNLLVKELSDGEHQFLHSIGMCLLARAENTLFLLDEPETHFNPDWRSQFISTLKKCMEIPISNSSKNKVSHEMLITSHSPFIVSDCDMNYVYIFEKNDKTNELEWTKPSNQTFGASVNFLTNDIFNKRGSISVLGEEEINRLMRAANNAADAKLLSLKNEALLLGDSVEKMFLLDFIDQKLKVFQKPRKIIEKKSSKPQMIKIRKKILNKKSPPKKK
ncbi:MAG: hypothetical protein JWP81_1568 [Ferruginibacter sp.]|nr:hypothetical protein [Ferruginibacter sp.]